MKLLRRRSGAPVASYAAVLDGAHLWLEVEPGAARISARDAGTGAVLDLGAQPHDLGGLSGSTYDVLADESLVQLDASTERPLHRTPLTPDGLARWEVVRHDDGHLQLVRRSVAPTAELDAVDVRGDRVHLRIRPPEEVEPGWHLLLLDTDDAVLGTLPATAHEGLLETLIGVDDLPAGYFGVLRLAVGTDAARLRVRRRANDLADPHHAVLLPELLDDQGRLRARLRWNPDGLLALRSIDPDETETEAEVTRL
jgi:hypothetical protein